LIRWLHFLFFAITSALRLKSNISLSAKIKSPRFLRLEQNCTIRSGCFIDAPGPGFVMLGNDVNLNRNVYVGGFGPALNIGDRTQLNRGVCVDGRGGVSIGTDVLIGPGAQLISYQHKFSDRNKTINTQGFSVAPIIVEDDVWIGANAVLVSGVTIGKGSVVGAGAVVTRSFPPYSIIAGVPARTIGTRGAPSDEGLT